MAARRVRVAGRVQGVFYRAWTKEQAATLGVCGWVRNCSDGSVEAHLEGEDANVDALVERMRAGPPRARVDELSSAPAEAQNYRGFALRH